MRRKAVLVASLTACLALAPGIAQADPVAMAGNRTTRRARQVLAASAEADIAVASAAELGRERGPAGRSGPDREAKLG